MSDLIQQYNELRAKIDQLNKDIGNLHQTLKAVKDTDHSILSISTGSYTYRLRDRQPNCSILSDSVYRMIALDIEDKLAATTKERDDLLARHIRTA